MSDSFIEMIRSSSSFQRISSDLKGYWEDPLNNVLSRPDIALIYTIALKIFALLVSLICPVIGGTIIGLSIGLIDRIFILHPQTAYERFKEVLIYYSIISFFRGIGRIVGGNNDEHTN